MNMAAQAILHGIDTDNVPSPSGSVLLVRGDSAMFAEKWPDAAIWTPYAEEAAIWNAKGRSLVQFPENGKRYESVVLLCPKGREETEYLLAACLAGLAPAGLLIAAAENLAGGRSLPNVFAEFGLSPGTYAKHKSRVVFLNAPANLPPRAVTTLKTHGPAKGQDGMWRTSGLFSAKELDTGTSVLLDLLPENLGGKGADFGCGIGEIGTRLLSTRPGVKHLLSVDHDSRAVACAERNLACFAEKSAVLWADVTARPPLKNLDFVVMNPPFHEGRREDIALGKRFIACAADSLKQEGELIMVANLHLPYEGTISAHFKAHDILGTAKGFKVIRAKK